MKRWKTPQPFGVLAYVKVGREHDLKLEGLLSSQNQGFGGGDGGGGGLGLGGGGGGG